MIHSYRFKNFLSFKDETEISFKLPISAPKNNLFFWSKADPKIRLSKAIAVFGPNASGKTNLLKPLAFSGSFINNSFFQQPLDSPLPTFNHFINTNPDQSSEFLIEFELDKKIYQYELVINTKKVLQEILRIKTSSKFSYIFERNFNPEKGTYEIKQDGFGFNQQEAEKVRPNASLISTAAQYQTPLALTLKDYFSKFAGNIGFVGRVNPEYFLIQVASLYQKQTKIKEQMINIMKKIDLGLSNIVFKEEYFNTADPLTNQPIRQKFLAPHGIHSVNGKDYDLPFLSESNGTRSAFVLLYQLLFALSQGSIAIIDELEQDFHPDILEYILNLFFDPATNPNNAQIIFTSHSHEIMNLLDKTQIILVEKDEDCISHAWCLDDMKGVRRDENWFAKYRAGAYRAIPNLE